MQLSSQAFEEGGQIPVRYTKDGGNISPPLRWWDLPARTVALALVLENITPETRPPFVQWLAYGIDPESSGLPEGFRHSAEPEEPAPLFQGRNDFGNIGYDGPVGALNQPIRYRLTLFALDRDLDLPAGEDKKVLARRRRGHVVGEANLHLIYQRRR